MKKRHEHILGEVVRAYMDTGQPVSSRMVVEQGQLDLSPASVRHVMAELEEQGFLCSPHTSAGRIPSDAGLRYFVDTLMIMDSDMQPAMEQVVSGHLSHVGGQQRLLKRATDELANLTHFAGLVWVREPGVQQIHKLELVPVSSDRILAVIVTDTGEVQNRLIHRPARIGEDALRRISARLNELLHECGLACPLPTNRTSESFQTGQTKAQCAANGCSIGKCCNAGMAYLERFPTGEPPISYLLCCAFLQWNNHCCKSTPCI